MGKQIKRFTIAVIHRNGAERLQNVLGSILNSMSDKDEVIVVDNNSSDDSIRQIEKNDIYKQVKFIKNTCNAGYGHSCNQAMTQGSGR